MGRRKGVCYKLTCITDHDLCYIDLLSQMMMMMMMLMMMMMMKFISVSRLLVGHNGLLMVLMGDTKLKYYKHC